MIEVSGVTSLRPTSFDLVKIAFRLNLLGQFVGGAAVITILIQL